jgi:MFS family permease
MGNAIKDIFRTLGCRNFRLFFVGEGISLIGTWIQRIALPWLVYQRSGSTLMLGLVAFAGLAPSFIMAPVAGVLIDRWNRYHIVMATQILSLVQALTLAYCCYTGNISVGIIILLNVFLGVINAFEMPARQAFLPELIDDKTDYCNAMAINSTIVNGARLIGPSIAGIIITYGGEALCFLINGMSYIAVIASLVMMKTISTSKRTKNTGLFREMKEGFAYAFGFQPVKNVLLLYGLVCLSGWPYTVLMPVIARDLLQGGANTFSMLMMASGAGALIGAMFLGSKKNNSGMDIVIACTTALFGIAIIALSFSRNLILSIVVVAVIGACMMMLMAAIVSLIQTIIEENKRGRIMSCYTMIFTGAATVGSYLAGVLSARLGTPHTLFLGGILCVIAAFAFIARTVDCYEIVLKK